MHKHYENEFKQKILQLHIGEGRSIRSLSQEYNVSHGSITSWTTQFWKEWEWAAKGGSDDHFSGTDIASELIHFAWYDETSEKGTHEVKRKEPKWKCPYECWPCTWSSPCF